MGDTNDKIQKDKSKRKNLSQEQLARLTHSSNTIVVHQKTKNQGVKSPPVSTEVTTYGSTDSQKVGNNSYEAAAPQGGFHLPTSFSSTHEKKINEDYKRFIPIYTNPEALEKHRYQRAKSIKKGKEKKILRKDKSPTGESYTNYWGDMPEDLDPNKNPLLKDFESLFNGEVQIPREDFKIVKEPRSATENQKIEKHKEPRVVGRKRKQSI